jgi:hypothetical protein
MIFVTLIILAFMKLSRNKEGEKQQMSYFSLSSGTINTSRKVWKLGTLPHFVDENMCLKLIKIF